MKSKIESKPYPDESKVVLSSSSSNLMYMQKQDSCDTSDDFQTLNIRYENAGSGDYFVIETKRWAFDKIEDFITIIKDFERRMK